MQSGKQDYQPDSNAVSVGLAIAMVGALLRQARYELRAVPHPEVIFALADDRVVARDAQRFPGGVRTQDGLRRLVGWIHAQPHAADAVEVALVDEEVLAGTGVDGLAHFYPRKISGYVLIRQTGMRRASHRA